MRALPWIVVVCGCATPQQPQPATQPAPYQEEEETSEVGAREGTATPGEYQMISDLLQRKTEAIHHCYEQEMTKRMDRSFKGTVTVSMVVGRDGRVVSVTILEDELESPPMNQCLIDTIKSFSFGTLTGEARLDYPIAFEPQY